MKVVNRIIKEMDIQSAERLAAAQSIIDSSRAIAALSANRALPLSCNRKGLFRRVATNILSHFRGKSQKSQQELGVI